MAEKVPPRREPPQIAADAKVENRHRYRKQCPHDVSTKVRGAQSAQIRQQERRSDATVERPKQVLRSAANRVPLTVPIPVKPRLPLASSKERRRHPDRQTQDEQRRPVEP